MPNEYNKAVRNPISDFSVSDILISESETDVGFEKVGFHTNSDLADLALLPVKKYKTNYKTRILKIMN